MNAALIAKITPIYNQFGLKYSPEEDTIKEAENYFKTVKLDYFKNN